MRLYCPYVPSDGYKRIFRKICSAFCVAVIGMFLQLRINHFTERTQITMKTKRTMRKTKYLSRWFSTLAFLLSLLMIFGSLPAQAIGGMDSDGTYELPPEESEEFSTIHEDVDEIETEEMTDLREENVKHFQLPDGSTQAVVYPGAVHRKDRNGNWQDIDNRLYLSNSRLGETGYATADGRVRVGEGLSAGTLLTISENGYEITLTPVSNGGHEVASIGGTASAQGVGTVVTDDMTSLAEVLNHAGRAQISDDDTAEEKLAKLKAVENRTTVKYNAFRQNAALEYVLDGNDVKENIIVSTRGESYSYAFTLRLEGLAAVLCADGSIELKDAESGETKYLMPAPYMYDAEGNLSEDVHYNFADRGNGEYYIAVIASPEWINESGRAFPVTIDPTVTIPNTGIKSTLFSQRNPDTNYGNLGEGEIDGTDFGLFKFDLPYFPEVVTINSAKLYVYMEYSPTLDSNPAEIGTYYIYEEWEPETVTARSLFAKSSDAIWDYETTTTVLQPFLNPQPAEFNILPFVESWMRGSCNNNGVAVRYINYPTYVPSVKCYTYFSNTSTSLKPYVEFNYLGYLASGVYSFSSIAKGAYWISVKDAVYLPEGEVIEKHRFAKYPHQNITEEEYRAGLFKVSRVIGEDRYILRSMLDNTLTIGSVASNEFGVQKFVTKRIPAEDALVSDADTFYIDVEIGGTALRSYTMSNRAIAIANTSNSNSDLVGDYVTSSHSKWKPHRYTGIDRYGIEMWDSANGTTCTGKDFEVTGIGWSTVKGINAPVLEVNSSVSADATSEKTDTGLNVMPHLPGSVQICAKLVGFSNQNTVYYTTTHSVAVELPIPEEVYFFKNYGYQNAYMQINNNDGSHDYSTPGAIMELWGFSGEAQQKWRLEHVRNGYYKIVSCKSGLVLSVNAKYLTVSDKAILQEPYTGADRQQWNFERLDNGRWVIRPLSARGDKKDFCLCAGFALSTNGTDVEQRYRNADDGYMAEWTLQCQNIRLNTPHIMQVTGSWCWVACAQMLARTYVPTQANDGSTQSILEEQRRAVYYVFGDPSATADTYDWVNDPQNLNQKKGIYSDVAKAAAYFSSCKDVHDTYVGYASPYTEDVLLRLILDGNPVVRMYGWARYDFSARPSSSGILNVLENLVPDIGGHVTIICGARWSEPEGCYKYTVLDPQKSRSEEYTYNELLCNCVQNGSQYTTSFWFPSVVRKNEYSTETWLQGITAREYQN